MSARFDARMHAYEEQTRSSGMIYVLMVVVALAFAGFVWQLYSNAEAPRIAAPPGPYKVEPSSEAADAGEQPAVLAAVEAGPAQAGAEHTLSEGAASRAASSDGPFVAQLAALQSEAAVEQAWRRFNARAPALFSSTRLDVQRADLGARGIYYRVRAGYFASRGDAAQFCSRIRELGQDCIPAAR